MRDRFYGSFSTVHVHVRPQIPSSLEDFNPDTLNGDFEFNWRNLTPKNLWRCIWNRYNWSFWVSFSRGVNSRCYCPDGWNFSAHILIAGFGGNLWLSHYGGPDPCPCDEAIAKFNQDDEE